MDNVNTVFSAVSLIALVLGAAAMAVAFYKTNLGKATIDLQASNIAALTKRVEQLTSDVATLTKQNTDLHSRNQYLEGMVTGKQELTQILNDVSAMKADLSHLTGMLTSIATMNSSGQHT